MKSVTIVNFLWNVQVMEPLSFTSLYCWLGDGEQLERTFKVTSSSHLLLVSFSLLI